MNSDLPQWIDFHCHLDLFPDHEALLALCEKQRIATLAITTTPRAWIRNRQLARGPFVKVALGLHPQLVAEHAHELTLWKSFLSEARFIGEVGLDAGPRFYPSFEQQKSVFKTILESCAEAGDKILSVHSVRCATTVLDMIEKYLPSDRSKFVMHWFTGSEADAKRALSRGAFFSINADMLRSSRGRNIVMRLPLDSILTETDGPFGLVEGRPARPTDVVRIVDQLAQLRSMPTPDLAATLVTNWVRLVGGVSGWKS